MPRLKYHLRFPVALLSALCGWSLSLLIFFLISNSVWENNTEVFPALVTTGLTAFIFSFILAAYAEHKIDADHRVLYTFLFKGLMYGLIASVIVSAMSGLFLLYGLSQVLGSSIGIISTLLYWFYPNRITPISIVGAAGTLSIAILIIPAFFFILWPMAERYLPSMAYQFGTWDARERIETGVAQSIKVGDEFSQYERFVKTAKRVVPSQSEWGFILGHTPTYSFCVKNGMIMKIKIFKNSEDIWLFKKCTDY